MSKIISNSFMLPNIVIDELLPHLSDAALRVYLIIVRKTRGWHKEADRISISQFERIGGKSRHTVISGLNELEKMGIVKKTQTEKGNVWELDDTEIFALVQDVHGVSANSALDDSANSALGVVQNLHIHKNTITKDTITKDTNKKQGLFKEQSLEIFEHWKTVFKKPNTLLTPKRKAKIVARLGEGYTVEQIKTAIERNSKSDFHVQNNHHDIELICRSAEKMDYFLGLKPEQPKDAPFHDSGEPFDRSKYRVEKPKWAQ